MAPRLDNVKFNLMRAIELFEDMNDEDMDVTAPPSSLNYFKEQQVAEHLNDCLSKLIEDGFFDDCDLRDCEQEEEEEQDNDDLPATPRSEGFEFEAGSSSAASTPDDEEEEEGTTSGRSAMSADEEEDERRGSRESFTDRFKRYIKRILPGGRRAGSRRANQESSRSLSLSYDRANEDQDDEGPYDPKSAEFGSNEHFHQHDTHDHHHHQHQHQHHEGAGTRSSSSSSSSGMGSGGARQEEADSSFIDDSPIASSASGSRRSGSSTGRSTASSASSRRQRRRRGRGGGRGRRGSRSSSASRRSTRSASATSSASGRRGGRR